MKKLLIIAPLLLIVILGIVGWNSTYKGKLALENLGNTNSEVVSTGDTTETNTETTTTETITTDNTTTETPVIETTTTDNTEPTNTDSSGISQEEFAKHNNADDCWIVYKGSVYDITAFLPLHPGGSRSIAQYCGTMGFENAFLKKHGTSKENMLETKAGKLEGELAQ